ncbi:hypothetical protein PVA17_08720 [Lysinibacillus sp. CNPSo 3705]|uniref:hypothetical protein n=1 Tax=Lysinibacillus sp. CNPSo 3705 TaxID=3028148 RepID=UPI0023643915|nr:hypothetical protein [Lysinibacillus sp. CNPSo 3705]MDD1502852.1 hypothetical protein [Lysinibacillus sp. CNPSo 3705]
MLKYKMNGVIVSLFSKIRELISVSTWRFLEGIGATFMCESEAAAHLVFVTKANFNIFF